MKDREQKAKFSGGIRVRSNVCFDRNAEHLIPGDILKAYSMSPREITRQQKAEMMYYHPCCLCRRTVYVFMEEGCDYCASRGHGVPSVNEAKRIREKRLLQEDKTLGKGGFE
jgi:hypothetical protein